MIEQDIIVMEKDGAVEIPDKYKKMSYAEISAECIRLENKLKSKPKSAISKTKPVKKTKFTI